MKSRFYLIFPVATNPYINRNSFCKLFLSSLHALKRNNFFTNRISLLKINHCKVFKQPVVFGSNVSCKTNFTITVKRMRIFFRLCYRLSDNSIVFLYKIQINSGRLFSVEDCNCIPFFFGRIVKIFCNFDSNQIFCFDLACYILLQISRRRKRNFSVRKRLLHFF